MSRLFPGHHFQRGCTAVSQALCAVGLDLCASSSRAFSPSPANIAVLSSELKRASGDSASDGAFFYPKQSDSGDGETMCFSIQ
jgi:hypothetical protein